MASAILFDLWNTIIYCPTRGKIEEIIKLLGLEGKSSYRDIIDRMGETIFVDCDFDAEKFFKGVCQENNVDSTPELIMEAASIWESRLDHAEYFPETEVVLSDLKNFFSIFQRSVIIFSFCYKH